MTCPEFTGREHNNSDDDTDSESDEDDALDSTSIDGTVHKQMPVCDSYFAHSLQLIVKDGINAVEGQILKLITIRFFLNFYFNLELLN